MFALSQFSGPDYLGAWNRLNGEWKPVYALFTRINLTTLSNCMLHHIMPGPLVLRGVWGVRLPKITRGVLPRRQNSILIICLNNLYLRALRSCSLSISWLVLKLLLDLISCPFFILISYIVRILISAACLILWSAICFKIMTRYTWGFLFHLYLRFFLFYGFSLLICLFQANVRLNKHAYLCVTKKYVLVAVQDGGIELYRQQL